MCHLESAHLPVVVHVQQVGHPYCTPFGGLFTLPSWLIMQLSILLFLNYLSSAVSWVLRFTP